MVYIRIISFRTYNFGRSRLIYDTHAHIHTHTHTHTYTHTHTHILYIHTYIQLA